MGNYNPSSPEILGQEWVGIREESAVFSPQVNSHELGHTFTTQVSNTLDHGRYYLREMPPNAGEAVYSIAVYPEGSEALSGPVKRLVIPVQSAFVTGGTVSSGTAVNALLTPTQATYIFLLTSNADAWLTLGFNTAPYTILNGKRIVRASLLYAAEVDYEAEGEVIGPNIYISESATFPIGASTNAMRYSDGSDIPFTVPGIGIAPDLLRADFGEVCHFWNPGVGGTNPEALPWNFSDLLRFDPDTGGTKLYVNFVSGSNILALPGAIIIWYAALEILYCEEQRVIVGGSYRGTRPGVDYLYGANFVRLRNLATRAASPVLPAGTWTATVSALSRGDALNDVGYPDLYALRELYQIPSHEGKEIFLTQTEGQEFTVESTHILPQLSLHASGGTLTEPHAYGSQWPAPVYGSVIATQEIRDDVSGVDASYPQVRFWARHWTGATAALVVSGLGAHSGSTAQISVADFDELPIIRDGWREVNLTFANAPTMGAQTPDPLFAWTSFGEVAGSRWELLSVRAYAASGVAGNLLQLATPASQLPDSATYQPPVGATIELSTTSFYASGGASPQSDIDACVLFSQTPYTVTGLTLNTLEIELEGIATDCGGDTPCCMPTSLSYHRLTWPTLAMSATGFGAFELQRWDAPTDEWHTIMSASSPTATGFNDYEARVGVASAYRIRVLNLYRFAGAWSAQVSGLIEAPGAVVECIDDSEPIGVLHFTTNEVQSGASNLSYVMTFGRSADEQFAFPEASRSQLRWQHGRNFQVAYRPDERGGEAFSRQMLIQAAAGTADTLSHIRSLSDLAWADLDYVCVRDDRGNRWFANVNVPGGALSQMTHFVAQVDITEVTQTPTEVDPE